MADMQWRADLADAEPRVPLRPSKSHLILLRFDGHPINEG